MPRKCSICQHPQLNEINQEIVKGTPYRVIALRFRVGHMAVARHAKSHLPATLVKAKKAEEAVNADDLLAEVRELKDKALKILETAQAAGDLRTALAGIREARGCLKLQTRMLCEIDNRRKNELSGRRPLQVIAGPGELLVIDRTAEEQRNFERVLDGIRETAEEAGLVLPEEE